MFARQPCKDYLKGISSKLPCDNWHPPECQFKKSPKRDVNSAISARFRTGRLKVNQIKSRREGGDRSAVAIVYHRTLSFQILQRFFCLNDAELETVKVSKNRTTVVTANGEVQTKEEATVYVEELDLFVTAKLLEDTPAVLSLGKLCEDHGYSYEWTSGHKPQLIKNRRRIICSTENYVPTVVLGLSTGSSSSSSPTSPTSLPQEAVIPTQLPASTRSESMGDQVRGESSRDLPVWLEEFEENLVDVSVPEHRDASSSSHEFLSEPRGNMVRGKHCICTHFPESQNYKGLLAEAQKSFTLTILWNLASLAKNYPGIIVRQHLTVQKQTGLLRERYAGLKKGHLPYVAIRSG